ncbi:GNAT family N-acetyltransferase [Streptomyces sp. NBC_00190]|uniref:GNAT family N-acetyltransferase n=1 Tax=unclassified Streptomyces TaxID=2593676 RepID=UPI002E29A5BA|nr:GNAT family N-acetyltransferase [Streptomyces sp. NBC_00190]WSZ42899.1 GNAT family N-acetyltransferase [Streptomyces sp. NBC_00868]
MKMIDEHGLSVALIEATDLTAEPWLSSDQHIDVVRMLKPPADVWDDLTARGFIRKPEMLTWLARLEPDEDQFLARLDNKSRQDIRRAQRRAAGSLREVVQDQVDAEALDRFLTLYEERVAGMQFGVPYARRHREAVLHGPQKYFAHFAFDGDEMVGGCLVLECPEEDAIRIRFSAVSESWRKSSLARTLYFAAMQTARRKGYTWATLGDEPNLYGHLTQAGLFSFKVNMGFTAVPSQDFADPTGCDEADLVLSLTALNDPCLILGYAHPSEGADRALDGILITESDIDANKFSAPFLATMETRSPGAPRGTRH